MRRLTAKNRHTVSLTLNGRPIEGLASPRMLLSDFLRQELAATGTHVGCEHGVCGACTVRIDGMMARGCLTLAVQVDGSNVDTVEGLATTPDRLSVLQESFRKNHALQCGFCTPGILMSLDTLLQDEPLADEERIRDVLSGHLCRCTGYHAIHKAAVEAAETLRKETGHA
jgi:2-furoyl-CoA dehydrogenase 2Fe-2S iron sulfur subunit